jgi:hypothetical protein
MGKIGKMKIKMLLYVLSIGSLILSLFILFECGGMDNTDKGTDAGGVEGTSSITVSWNANKETLVNDLGGGYRVYYSKKPGFKLNDSGVYIKEIHYISGPQTPTSTTLTIENGTWYIKVMAFMYLKGECVSVPSVETSITLP